MKILAKMLFSNQVGSLIKSKGSKKSQFFTLTADDTIRTALMTFVQQDISAIPIRGDGQGSEFLGMLNITDILKYILKGAPESFYKQDVQTLLNRKISVCIQEVGIRKAKIISEQLNLMQLIFDHWGKTNPLDHDEVDIKHLLVNIGSGKYDVVTPSDLLRYILLLSHSGGYLRRTKACEIISGFKFDDNKIIRGEEDAWLAFKKLLDNRPYFILGIVDEESGSLEANLSAIDFLPSAFSLSSNFTAAAKSISLEESISMLRRPGLSLYAFVHSTKSISIQNDLDPILLQPHFTLADLIEKMAKMKIHQLWRVNPTRVRSPVGVVGICDVIFHFCKIFEPFYGNENLLMDE